MSTTPLTKSAIAIDEVETLVLHHALKLLQFVGEAGHIPTRLLEDIERMTGSRPAMWSVNEKINTLKKLLAPMWKFETEDRTGIEAGTHTSGAEDGNEKEEMGQGEIQSNWDEIVGSFEDMNLNPDLLRSIQTHGFDRPTSIQQHAILPLIKNHDLICQAPSGTGKTAYVISILQNLDTTVPDCQALIIVPNHELAQQIQRFVSTLGEPLKADCHACIGGTNVREDVKRFKFESDSARPHIVVGTLGRVHDLINRRALRIEAIKCFVIDEADDMLSRAFKEQMYGLAKIVPQTAQKALFAATLSQEVSDFTEKFMRKPYQIKFRHLEKVTLDGLDFLQYQTILRSCRGGQEAQHSV
ncbi:P-loop containing nucleoside triphosphate hydrolase protein [Jimgerdemannia flammicorona]|uniref:RNA helicase n=1 Tax=Jimgerdemannia flammicorona TaxID=994334 RepID=A0A433DKP1_9FUNG|nr:P-loop containing nucleoside triphosphate hydrolase protein [Jimgerdemannia flammicorona]